MNDSTYNNPINYIDHPNLEFEEDFKSLQRVIEIGNSSDDYANLNYFNDKIFRTKFDNSDIDLFNELKNKYLIHESNIKEGAK